MDNVFENFWLKGGIERGQLERKQQEEEGAIRRSYVGDYTIDSCNTFDEGYETAIWKGSNSMIITERYDTYEEMKKGHKKWCEFCKNNPKSAYSVQLDEECDFE